MISLIATACSLEKLLALDKATIRQPREERRARSLWLLRFHVNAHLASNEDVDDSYAKYLDDVDRHNVGLHPVSIWRVRSCRYLEFVMHTEAELLRRLESDADVGGLLLFNDDFPPVKP